MIGLLLILAALALAAVAVAPSIAERARQIDAEVDRLHADRPTHDTELSHITNKQEPHSR